MANSQRCAVSSRALRSVFSTPSRRDVTLPTFLVPAFARPSQTSHFSTTPSCASKIGAAPLSLPPDVTFTVAEQPAAKAGRGGISASLLGPVVHIEGPLGKMNYTIPPYMSITANSEARTHTLSILDAEDKKQRAMWGE